MQLDSGNLDSNTAYIPSVQTHESFVTSALTRRERFAAMALQGLLAGKWEKQKDSIVDATNQFAAAAVNCADALITELDK